MEEDNDATTENPHTQMEFRLYPNPVSNYTMLDLGGLKGLDVWYQLCDIHSRPVLAETILANPVVVDLSNIVPGT